MAKPGTRGPHAEFGEWLRAQRQKVKRLSQLNGQTVAKDLGLLKITQGKLSHLERGFNGNPAPELLREVATLYETPYEEIVRRWVEHRFGVPASGIDLTRHGSAVSLTPQQEGAIDAAATRIRELEGKLEDRETQLRHVEDAARRLVKLFAVDEEGRAARRPKRPRGGGDRKAG